MVNLLKAGARVLAQASSFTKAARYWPPLQLTMGKKRLLRRVLPTTTQLALGG